MNNNDNKMQQLENTHQKIIENMMAVQINTIGLPIIQVRDLSLMFSNQQLLEICYNICDLKSPLAFVNGQIVYIRTCNMKQKIIDSQMAILQSGFGKIEKQLQTVINDYWNSVSSIGNGLCCLIQNNKEIISSNQVIFVNLLPVCKVIAVCKLYQADLQETERMLQQCINSKIKVTQTAQYNNQLQKLLDRR